MAQKEQFNKDYHIITHAYTDLKALSVEVDADFARKKAGYTRPMFSRSLGAFAAGFCSEFASFKFTDVISEVIA